MKMVKTFGKGSQLFYNFLTLAILTTLMTCSLYYKKRGHNYAAAPKVGFFKLDGNGRRPVYAWGQHTKNDKNFLDHAGYIIVNNYAVTVRFGILALKSFGSHHFK